MNEQNICVGSYYNCINYLRNTLECHISRSFEVVLQIHEFLYKDVVNIFLSHAPQIRLLQNLCCSSKLLSFMVDNIITNQYYVWKFTQYNGRRLCFAREAFFLFPFLNFVQNWFWYENCVISASN